MIKDKTRAVISGIVGNLLEIYDFSLYGIFSPILAIVFFPNNGKNNLLITLVIFATGFFMRPIGAIFFGYLGDKLGRKKALILSINLMALPTFIISILPGYSVLGIAAPVLLIFCRLLQGLCAGGELTGAIIFSIEHNDKRREGLISGLIILSASVGSLLAMLQGAFFLQEGLPSWVWRIPFLLGTSIAIVGIYIRKKIEESPEFKQILIDKSQKQYPIINVLSKNMKSVLCAIGISAFGSSLGCTTIIYINIYLHVVVGIDVSKSMLFTSVGILSFALFCPISGYFSDKFGRDIMLKLGGILILVSSLPIFVLLNTKLFIYILIAQMILGVLAGIVCGSEMAFISNLFPTNVRYTGVSFSHCIGVSIIGGGILPFINTLLIDITKNVYVPAFYLIFSSLIGLISVHFGKNFLLKYNLDFL